MRRAAMSSFPLFAGAAIVATLAFTHRCVGQTVLDNPSTAEQVYAQFGDGNGGVTSHLLVSKGKAYLRNGEVEFGTGSHHLKNLDGKGAYISVIASMLARAAMWKTWVLGFRADDMRFHWDLDAARGQEMSIIVDTLAAHDNTVTSGGVLDYGTAGEYKERSVGARQISVQEGRIVLHDVSNLPYSLARTYIAEQSAGGTSKSSFLLGGDCGQRLIIRADGTIAHQDIMVHLTSPRGGESETLLRNVTLVNQYKDDLTFVEIRGTAGKRTGTVLFNKGQSVCFDDRGNPVSGEGKFEIEPTSEGQAVGGWLSTASLSVRGNMLRTAGTLEFKSTSTWLRWTAIAAISGVALALAFLCFRRFRRATDTETS